MPPRALAEMAAWRAVAYRVLAAVLLPPDTPRVRRLRAAAFALTEDRDRLAGLAVFPPWTALLASLRRLRGRQIRDLQATYVRLFGLGDVAAGCPPYESHYRAHDAEARALLVATLEREYAAAGLAVPGGRAELPDHAAVEIEFLAFLCGEEGLAWEQGDVAQALQMLDRQRGFLERHVARWVPDFARTVAGADPGGFYAQVVETAAAFVEHDLDLAGLIPAWAATLPAAAGPAEARRR